MRKYTAYKILKRICQSHARGIDILKKVFPKITSVMVIKEFMKDNNAVRSFSYFIRRIERHDVAEIWEEWQQSKKNIDLIREVFNGKRSIRGRLFQYYKYHIQELSNLEGCDTAAIKKRYFDH